MSSDDLKERCILCGDDRRDGIAIAFDRVVPRREDYEYTRCRNCRLVSLSPRPEPHEIADFYSADYEPHVRATEDPRRLRPSRGSRRGVLEPHGSNRLLDVGCGSGALLARHRARGWEVCGVEPNARAVAACRDQGLAVQHADFSSAELPSGHFDVVLLHHVIEHVREPVAALRSAREVLAPGGWVAVVTPNVAGLGFRRYGSCWYALDAPRHLHLFDESTLRRLSGQAGLEVISMSSRSSPRVLARSRHYERTQGPMLPPGYAARSAALSRSREDDTGSAGFRRAVRPLAQVAAWASYGETLQARLADPSSERPDSESA
jgi:SAM-dependent methyltransferase